MKVKELFKPVNISHSIGGTAVFLDRDNCQIKNNKTKKDDSVILYPKRESDGEEGRAHLKVKDEFKSLSTQLLRWAFINKNMQGLTLNQLESLETGLNIESIGGRLQLKT